MSLSEGRKNPSGLPLIPDDSLFAVLIKARIEATTLFVPLATTVVPSKSVPFLYEAWRQKRGLFALTANDYVPAVR